MVGKLGQNGWRTMPEWLGNKARTVGKLGQKGWKTRPEWLMLSQPKKCENLVELSGSFLYQVIRGVRGYYLGYFVERGLLDAQSVRKNGR